MIYKVSPTGEKNDYPTPAPLVRVLMVHEAQSAVESGQSDVCQSHAKDFEMNVKQIESEPKNITVVRQVELKAICETLVLVCTQATSLIDVTINENVAKTHSGMTPEKILYVYRRCSFHINISNFGKVDVSVPSY